MTKMEKAKSAMMCWEPTSNLSKEETHKEPEKVAKKPAEKTEKQKHEEEHVRPTLDTGSRLKILIKEFSWEREADESTLETEEPNQQQMVYITNLEDRSLRKFGEMAVIAIHEGKKMRSKLDDRGKTCMFVGYADDHTKDVYRFLNIHTRRIILSRDVRWLNTIWKQYKKKSLYAGRQVELFLYEEERSLGDETSFGESSIEVIEEESESDGNNTETQKKLGIDINMIGARKETLGKTRSETKALSSPTNESMERADLTMEDWIQETCLISAVTSGPTKPKTFQEAWHYPIENERERWRIAFRTETRSMIERGVWRKTDRKKIPNNRRLSGNKWVFKIKRDGTYRARLVALGYSQIPRVDYTDNFAPVAHDVSFRIALARMMVENWTVW